jgi:lipoate-protein ligase B
MQLDSAQVGNIAKALGDLDKQFKSTGIAINGGITINGIALDVRFDSQSERHVVTIGA